MPRLIQREARLLTPDAVVVTAGRPCEARYRSFPGHGGDHQIVPGREIPSDLAVPRADDSSWVKS